MPVARERVSLVSKYMKIYHVLSGFTIYAFTIACIWIAGTGGHSISNVRGAVLGTIGLTGFIVFLVQVTCWINAEDWFTDD